MRAPGLRVEAGVHALDHHILGPALRGDEAASAQDRDRR
jgi:hypothetical protein